MNDSATISDLARRIADSAAAETSIAEAMDAARPMLEPLNEEERLIVVRRVLAHRGYDDGLMKVSERAVRDAQSLLDFLRTRSLEECFRDPDLTARLYVRAAALVINLGFERSVDERGLLPAAERARRGIRALAVSRAMDAYWKMRAICGYLSLRMVIWLGQWFYTGCPRVRVTGHEAAALALTDLPDVFSGSDEVRAPWGQFLIDIPPGIIEVDDGKTQVSVTRIMMCRMVRLGNTQGCGLADLWLTMIGLGVDVACSWNFNENLAQRFVDDYEGQKTDRISDEVITESVERAVQCATRIAAGVCFALENARQEGRITVRRSAPSRVGGPPTTTDYRLGLPVKTDFRQAVAEYTSGRRKVAYKSQWVVRGHWRHQACGKELKERRLTWIQPFWKGREHLPILVRAHELPQARMVAAEHHDDAPQTMGASEGDGT